MDNKYEPEGRTFTEVIREILSQPPSSVKNVETKTEEEENSND